MTNLENIKLEILVATMGKENLDFLKKMFPQDYKNYTILIINQTKKNKQLHSNLSNIRVINSCSKGLPQSRNLAIANAIGDICLVADDDVEYLPDFDIKIKEAYLKHKEATIITFKMKDDQGRDFKAYKPILKHDIDTIRTVNSVVISFNREKLLKNKVLFNNHFGLGSTFESANEYVFLRNALKANIGLYFEPEYILTHDYLSSGRKEGDDRIIFARSAVFYKYHGIKAYLKLAHYLYLIKKRGFITNKEFFKKFKTGLRGIATYRKLIKTGQEER
ncbi:glycosyltransferase family A protein [Lacinutrix chionoecetis]